MKDEFDSLNILAHESAKPKVEYLTRELYVQAGRKFDRRQLLGMGALAIIAAACGGTTTTGGGGQPTGTGPSASTLAGKPI